MFQDLISKTNPLSVNSFLRLKFSVFIKKLYPLFANAKQNSMKYDNYNIIHVCDLLTSADFSIVECFVAIPFCSEFSFRTA